MELWTAVAIVEAALTMQERTTAMHEWMMGVGIIVLLMTPCFIAMRSGVESADD